jgi:hypothetical protein
MRNERSNKGNSAVSSALKAIQRLTLLLLLDRSDGRPAFRPAPVSFHISRTEGMKRTAALGPVGHVGLRACDFIEDRQVNGARLRSTMHGFLFA